jgi:hypothetical protein
LKAERAAGQKPKSAPPYLPRELPSPSAAVSQGEQTGEKAKA